MCYMAARRPTVGVRELRQNLSVYLARVKGGATLTVTEHGHVVAILGPAPPRTDDLVERLVVEGRATPARRPPAALPGALRLKLKTPLGRELAALREDTI